MRRLREKGFTLVELLATIIILSLVLGIATIATIAIIDNVREKGYKTTIENIESEASNYLIENSDRLFYLELDGGNEYQCITIKNLIDMGYFDSDVLNSEVAKDVLVSEEDYVYVERNSTTKVITKTEYVGNTSSVCAKAMNAVGDIRFISSPSLDEWSKEKEITINYSLRNINDVGTVGSYEYKYSYSDGYEVILDDGNKKVIRVSTVGKLDASIDRGSENIISKSIDITTIDNEAPTITIDKEKDDAAVLESNIKVTLKDNGSGLKTGGILEYGFSESDSVEPTYERANLSYNNGDKETVYTIKKTGLNGLYYLWLKVDISDVLDNKLTYENKYGTYRFIYKFNVYINADEGIENVVGEGEYVVGDEVTISASPKNYYKWNGISGYVDTNEQTYTFTMPGEDVTFNISSLPYKCSSGTLTYDSAKGNICIKGPSSSTSSYQCGCTGYYCNCHTSCFSCPCHSPGGIAGNPADGSCSCCSESCSYCYSCSTCTSTSYYCPSGWSTYSGSGSSLRCYQNATV